MLIQQLGKQFPRGLRHFAWLCLNCGLDDALQKGSYQKVVLDKFHPRPFSPNEFFLTCPILKDCGHTK